METFEDVSTRQIYTSYLENRSGLAPEQSDLSLYYSSVHSHSQYLLSIWGMTAASKLEELTRLQNNSVRYVSWQKDRYGGLSADFLP